MACVSKNYYSRTKQSDWSCQLIKVLDPAQTICQQLHALFLILVLIMEGIKYARYNVSNILKKYPKNAIF